MLQLQASFRLVTVIEAEAMTASGRARRGSAYRTIAEAFAEAEKAMMFHDKVARFTTSRRTKQGC